MMIDDDDGWMDGWEKNEKILKLILIDYRFLLLLFVLIFVVFSSFVCVDPSN